MQAGKSNKIEEILNSLDGLQKATAPGFFYPRLKARLEKEILPAATKPAGILRPAYALAALAVVLLINATVILTRNNSGEIVSSSETETLQSIAADYDLNDVSSIYDLNEDR
ncbi:MAG: hypothetical protein FJY20_03050 [Bacteroidetes bacterium]|nr:hypothetical protein [Bacteroidota bacterium]